MFLRTRNQTIFHHEFLKLRELGIEKFQILSVLFSYLHVAFTLLLPACFAFSSFEISLADDQKGIVLFSFYEGRRILKTRFWCNYVSAATSTDAKKVTFSPSACIVCSNQRMISRISESLAKPINGYHDAVVARVLFKLAKRSPNLYRCGKGSLQVSQTYAVVGL